MLPKIGSHIPPAELTLLQLHQEMHGLEKTLMEQPLKQLERQRKEGFRLTEQEVQKVVAAAQAAQTSVAWSTLSQVSSCILALFNIFAGGTLLSMQVDTTSGAALVASGFLTLATMAISEKTWNWVAELLAGESEQKKERLLVILPMIISMMTLLLNAAACYQGLQEVMNANEIMNALQTATTFGTLALSLRKPYDTYQVSKAQRDVLKTQQKLAAADQEREITHRAIQALTSLSQQISRQVKDAFREAIAIAQNTTKRV
jgi:hypothetical protein